MNVPSTTDLLARNRFVTDEQENHIHVAPDCNRLAAELLVACCPAGVYSLAPDGSVAVEYAACLECGTCLAISDPGTLTWHYPRGGFGVQFRDG